MRFCHEPLAWHPASRAFSYGTYALYTKNRLCTNRGGFIIKNAWQFDQKHLIIGDMFLICPKPPYYKRNQNH